MFTRHAALLALVVSASLSPRSLRGQSLGTTAVGLIAGVSRTTLGGKDVAADIESRTNVLAGLSFVHANSARLHVEVDGLYARKGFRSPGATSTFDFTATYLEVPLLLRLNIAPERQLRPFVAGGTAVSVRLGCRGVTTSSTGSVTLSCDNLVARSGLDVNKTDVAAVLGGGVEFPVGAAQLTLATRYTMGFSRVIGGNDNYNRALSFYVGLAKARRE
ncbi:MAG: PorT family protein [Gemmatimonadaceae bacterium]|nr:PorT family protein [Gemmatimonadaceae bacterium]